MLRVSDYFEYTTKKGDTWDMIALDQMGDEMFMSDLVQYNIDYADTLIFDDGITLLVPILDMDDQSDASTLPAWRSGDSGDNESDDDNNGKAYKYELGDPDDEDNEDL